MSEHTSKTPKPLALKKKHDHHRSLTAIVAGLKKAVLWLKSTFVLKAPALAVGQSAAKPFPQQQRRKKADNRVRIGIVKFYNRSKRFGFICDENGVEIYVHSSGLKSRIAENDNVTFELEQNERGFNAVNVALSAVPKNRQGSAQLRAQSSYNITKITEHLF